MSQRRELPQLAGETFLTDGGLETDLIFNHGIDLPAFASFALLRDEEGTAALRSYFDRYAELAAERGLGLILESPTWRANPRWGEEIGCSREELEQLNRRAIALLEEIRSAHGNGTPIVISGNIGPQSDGYQPTELLSTDEARDYHSFQIGIFADTAADLVTAMTMTYVEEALGVTRAASEAGIPVVISFTTETDGRLPTGQSLGEAIEQVDRESDPRPAYFMINCAHPTHFESALEDEGGWTQRVRGLRANASRMSHAELDEATELDAGDPDDLAARYAAIRARLPELNVLGGCCGTDHRHVRAIRDAWLGRAAAA